MALSLGFRKHLTEFINEAYFERIKKLLLEKLLWKECCCSEVV